MAIAPDHSPSSSPADDNSADFGANDWLLQEMYEQYSADPDSVDASWAEFFKSHGAPGVSEPPRQGGNGASEPPTVGRTASPAPRRAAQQPEPTSNRPAPTPPTQPEQRPTARRAAGPVAVSNSAAADQQATATPSSRRQPTVERPIQVKDARPASPGARGGVPADPPNPANRPSVALEEPVRSVLRGAPARTAKNMDISLSVPTATSVRSLPVKLLIDQRVVINNHLRRARGGKVSYTHIIGYAMVRALETVPEMNNGYEMVDG
ncbi:MAG: 2-oxoglutarate dehydrogenase component, partial [Propionibacteriaceae bacterium]|nr:2-oxoglutarate dehydrogenase component [Propionibacteriaceae bacterium]